MTPEDEKILEQFPEYDGRPMHFLGSRKYWEGVFENETNRDPKLHEAFSDLHDKMVNDVIKFCKEHNLDVDELHLNIDGIQGSRDWGEWTCSTDSSMSMYVWERDKDGVLAHINREKPFLYEI